MSIPDMNKMTKMNKKKKVSTFFIVLRRDSHYFWYNVPWLPVKRSIVSGTAVHCFCYIGPRLPVCGP